MRFIAGFICGLVVGAKHHLLVLTYLQLAIDWFLHYVQEHPPTHLG